MQNNFLNIIEKPWFWGNSAIRRKHGRGNSWGKGEKTPWGGYTAKKDGHGSIYSKDVDSKGYVDHENHVHFHKDGATITKNGKKYTIKR